MPGRTQDTTEKIAELERLMAGDDAAALLEAIDRATMALDFRANDAVLGLPEVDGRIVLPAEASIEGMVTREDATVDARVSISYREEPQFMSDHRRLAPDGTYRFTCLSPGTAVVRVSERNGPSVERAVTIQAGQNLAADFTIERGTGEVVGAILDNGHPVTDVQLELRRIDGDSIESRRVFVDGDGGFQFDEVPAGELTLELERGGELADDARRKYEVKMTLREGETITQKIDLSQLR